MFSFSNTKRAIIRNLQVVLHWRDIPLIDINIVNGKLKSLTLLTSINSPYLPLEFRDRTITINTVNQFIESRVIPKRQTLSETLDRLGMVDYSWENILEKTFGTTTYDHYWLRPINSKLRYEDIRKGNIL